MIRDVEHSEKWRYIEKIDKGWSFDTKYFIETINGEKWILRISPIEFYEQKKKEYEVIGLYSRLGFPMSKPISFGVCNEGKQVYQLLTWVEGEELEQALPKLSPEQQYELGREAGRILRKIHQIPVPKDKIPTKTKIPRKKEQMNRYINSEVRIPNDEGIIKFFYENIDKIWSKPPVYQHGDFHPGNLILTPEGKIGVIDFNRWEIGDPYEEFYKLEIFGTAVSIPYSRGQIDAYFDDNVPGDFWEILAVYVAHASLYSIKWAEKFGQKDIDNMVKICSKSLRHYDHFQRMIPIWYNE